MIDAAVRSAEHRLTVVDVDELTPRMRRVVCAAPTLAGLPLRPAQDVGLQLTDAAGRPARRRYTLREVDPGAGTVALDGILHGHGPGAQWFSAATPGTAVDVLGPRGKCEVFDADWHLFVGDEAGWPAFAELAAALPDPSRARSVLEVDTGTDGLAMPGAVTHVERRGAEPGLPDLLAAGLTRQPGWDGVGAAYLLGESRAVVQLRPLLPALGVDPARVFLKGYWNRGRASR